MPEGQRGCPASPPAGTEGTVELPGTLRRCWEPIPERDGADPRVEEGSLWPGPSPRGASPLLMASSGDGIDADRTKPRSGGEEGRGCSASEEFFHRQARGEDASGLLSLGTGGSDERGCENKARGAPMGPYWEYRGAGPQLRRVWLQGGGPASSSAQLSSKSILPAWHLIKTPKLSRSPARSCSRLGAAPKAGPAPDNHG